MKNQEINSVFAAYNLQDKLTFTKNVINDTMAKNNFANVVAFSGGDDSLTVLKVLEYFNVKIDAVIFADTLIGFPATRIFVEKESGSNLIVTEPKKTLRELVMANDGFLGTGGRSHDIAFGELKGKPILSAISKEFRKRKRGRIINVFSGIRRNESAIRQRAKKYASPFNKVNNELWVAPILSWTKEDTLEFLEWQSIERNPISLKYGRSGDCHCGTAIANPKKEFSQLLQDAPDVAKEIALLDEHCRKNNLTRWCQKRNVASYRERKGQCNLFGNLDLCGGCKSRYLIELNNKK